MNAQAQVADDDDRMYKLDDKTRDLLIESAPLAIKWSQTECKSKPKGGMEEWAKEHTHDHDHEADALVCDWYHSTWQLLRLLNMVAVPLWYPFYTRAIATALAKRPNAKILISACADFGMLAALHEGIKASKTTPSVTIYDICETPLLSAQWYAERNGLDVECVCDNIITSERMPLGTFDLIVTDEFLTVLKDEYKPLITNRWYDLLAPGGVVVTTAMIGGETTPELRKGYAERARRLLAENQDVFKAMGISNEEAIARFDKFAEIHTRHMLTDEAQIRKLFEKFYLGFVAGTMTPGECVNPTYSYQIRASKPFV